MKGDVILLFLALWPMAGAFLGYLIGRRSKKARDYFADFVAILEFAIIAVLFVRVAGGANATLQEAAADAAAQVLALIQSEK